MPSNLVLHLRISSRCAAARPCPVEKAHHAQLRCECCLCVTRPWWLEWIHGYLRGRRQEDSEQVQRATSNACYQLACHTVRFGGHSGRGAIPSRGRVGSRAGRVRVSMRATNSPVCITTAVAMIEVLHGSGHYKGSDLAGVHGAFLR